VQYADDFDQARLDLSIVEAVNWPLHPCGTILDPYVSQVQAADALEELAAVACHPAFRIACRLTQRGG